MLDELNEIEEEIKQIEAESAKYDVFESSREIEKKSNLTKTLLLLFLLLLLVAGAIWYFTKSDSSKPADAVKVEQQDKSDDVTSTIVKSQISDNSTKETDANSNTQTSEHNSTKEDVSADSSANSTTDSSTNLSGESLEQTKDNNNNFSASDDSLSYFIVSGVFSDENNAQRKVESLKSSGYKALIVGKNNAGLYVVAFEGFSNIKDAKSKLEEITEVQKDAWIYKK